MNFARPFLEIGEIKDQVWSSETLPVLGPVGEIAGSNVLWLFSHYRNPLVVVYSCVDRTSKQTRIVLSSEVQRTFVWQILQSDLLIGSFAFFLTVDIILDRKILKYTRKGSPIYHNISPCRILNADQDTGPLSFQHSQFQGSLASG